MTVLRPAEMKLVDDLFGMNSGWILEFSNRTFEEFFRHEVGIEIYDACRFVGTPKGKHLSAFLQPAGSSSEGADGPMGVSTGRAHLPR
ncbi:hypothetical protein EHH54_12995 [Rhizobium leguminosarum]|uniref:hypothetical protein n=1 Tax=Rhizobium leguminosarum TaxID=384 RepID=UPI000FEC466E|nr:hypothetical protein [Rhizobium leguminosarum]RWX40249.1 hypothetical protein EHH54_12995 [Rhizobium leguminosarum]